MATMNLAPRVLMLSLCLVVLAACNSPSPPPTAAPAEQPGTGATAQPAPAEASEPDELAEVDPLLSEANLDFRSINEAFLTPLTPDDNVDSPASWTAPDGQIWLIATAKSTHRLLVYRGDTGELLRTVGEQGAAPGQFDRPNGVFVIDDLVLAVERDNRRVQVLRLPDFTPLGSFGEAELQQPYGLWLRRGTSGYEVLVSDAFMDPSDEDTVPPLDQLGRRFQRYRFEVQGEVLQARQLGSFGATDAAGAIRIPESLWGDETHDRLLISEEDQADGTRVKQYRLSDFGYAGSDLGAGLFRAQAEGIALYTCADGSGWWIATDQYKDRSLFHVFERASLAHRGSFAGAVVANTDGIWLDQTASARFPQGAFYAVHDDQGVGAFDWRDIASALGLESCR
jgi:3-phytase